MKSLHMGPFGFEILAKAKRPRVGVENPKGPTCMPFSYTFHSDTRGSVSFHNAHG
jgi:hypothetical protein